MDGWKGKLIANCIPIDIVFRERANTECIIGYLFLEVDEKLTDWEISLHKMWISVQWRY